MLNESRKRAVRADVRDSREALILTRPLSRPIGRWQADAARIAARVSSGQGKGLIDPALGEEIAELLDLVTAERQALRDRASNLSPAVAGNWRVVDMDRALGRLALSLAEARDTLLRH